MPTVCDDVTVLVLTVGEPTLSRCLAAIERQTSAPAETLIVRDRTPFHAAFNHGVAQVSTPYVLQCDVDMVLDPDCLAVLREAMVPSAVVAAGYLRDPLLGVVQAVKLFRTAPLREAPSADSISSETDVVMTLLRQGWKVRFARRRQAVPGRDAEVLGEHLPAYDDALYTFHKFRTLGAVVRQRGNARELHGCLDALRASRHPAASLALVAFCRGLFDAESRDQHRPATGSADFALATRLLAADNPETLAFATTRLPGFAPEAHLRALGWGV